MPTPHPSGTWPRSPDAKYTALREAGPAHVPSPQALARSLAWGPSSPLTLLAAVERKLYFEVEVVAQFVAIVETTFPAYPDVRQAILDAGDGGEDDEAIRVGAFLAEVNRRLFPVEEYLEDYAALAGAVPFQPLGFEDEALEELTDRPGYLALIALIAPDAPAAAARAHLLHERCGVALATLALLPTESPSLGELGRWFGGGPYAAVVDMARWLRAETGTAFLDNTYETASWHCWTWSARYIAALTEQWTLADALIGRVNALATWLEEDLPTRLRELLVRIAGRDARGRSRRAARRRSRKRGRARRAS